MPHQMVSKPATAIRSADGPKPAPMAHEATELRLWIPHVASVIVAGIGASVLIGWALEVPVLTSVMPGLRVMVPNTALAFVLSAVSLGVVQDLKRPSPARLRLAMVLCSGVLVLAGTTLAEYLTGLRVGVEQWFFVGEGGGGQYAGRMSAQTAVNFVLISLALLLLRSPRVHAGIIADTCSLAVLLVSWLALTGYAYDVTRLYDVPRYPGLALHTVIAFVALSVGLLFSRNGTVVGRLVGDGAAGALLRRFLPPALIIPLVLGWMRGTGDGAGWLDDPFAMAMLSLAFTSVLIVLVWISAGAVARMELQREHAERALLEAYDNLDAQVTARTAELADANDSLRFEIERRLEVEASLRVSERWFQDLFERAPDPMCSFDAASGEILECNQTLADVLGYRKDEVLGRAVLQLCEPDSVPAATAILERFARREPIADEDLVLRRKDGRSVDVSLSMSAVTDTHGRIVRVRSIWRDITARKRIQQAQADLLAREQAARRQAEEADRLKDEFLASVSHELRAPLNPILGWVHVLRQGDVSIEILERAIVTIERSARVQKQLVEDLLDAARITNGKLSLRMIPVDVASIVEGAVDATRPTAAAKGIAIICDHESGTGVVLGDPDRLHQVVWNLVGNAIKFTPSGGRVHVYVRRMGVNVEIVVRDTGPGIAADFLPYVFDRFRQADGSTTRRHGGLGLGLSIVRHLVELHGGSVRAENAAETSGATFVVTLPSLWPGTHDEKAGPAATVRLPSTAAAPPVADFDAAKRVLVVDDDPDTRELLVTLLTSHGARAEAVARTSDAMTRLITETSVAPFDAVVCDVGMPDEDGYAFIRRVRALHDPRISLIPAIALTGYARNDDRTRAMAAGFHAHLTKPVDAGELVKALGTLTRHTPGSVPLLPPSA